MYRNYAIIVTAICGMQALSAQASILVTAEAPGVQSSTVAGVTTETFNSFAPGIYTTLTTNVGTFSSSVGVVAANVFGGAGGTGRYLGVGVHSGTAEGSLAFLGGAQAHFGFWWSAADNSNVIDFYLGSTLLGSFDPSSALGALTDPAYFGNPNAGGNSTEKYAYINFVGTDGTTFDRVVFRSVVPRGFESDNHSIRAGQIPRVDIPDDVIGVIPIGPADPITEFFSRTVTSVNGRFDNFTPDLGFHSGEGTNTIRFGDPLPGSFQSMLSFEGYDRFPNRSQDWFEAGQFVRLGWDFSLGDITFRNGRTSTGSIGDPTDVDLLISTFGSEFHINSHPLILNDRLTLRLISTPDSGVDSRADADFFYLRDFPHLGSFRVREGGTASLGLDAMFGSIIPTGFADVSDPEQGFWVPSIELDPDAPGVLASVPEPFSFIVWGGLIAAAALCRRWSPT